MDRNSDAVRRAKQLAYRLLSYRGRTAHELRDRLQQRGHVAAVIEAVLHELEAEGYVNDRKLACEWARYRLQTKPLGRRRLAWELRKRGVEGELLTEVLHTVYDEVDEAELAEQAARRRLRSTAPASSSRAPARLTRYLMGLGFEPDTIAGVLTALFPSLTSREAITEGDPPYPTF